MQEIGEPHNRRFVIRCRLVSLISSQVVEAEGEGNSKKAAKQQACQQIYDKIKQIGKLGLLLLNTYYFI